MDKLLLDSIEHGKPQTLLDENPGAEDYLRGKPWLHPPKKKVAGKHPDDAGKHPDEIRGRKKREDKDEAKKHEKLLALLSDARRSSEDKVGKKQVPRPW